MSIETVRGQVAAQIKTDNAAYAVKSHPVASPDHIGANKVHVSVFRANLTRATAQSLAHNLTIEVMIGESDSEAAEDKLDVALDNVLLSLERVNGVTWTTADRTIFDDKFIGYSITLSCTSANVYKQIVLEEQKVV